MSELKRRLDQLKFLEGEINQAEEVLAHIDADLCKITATLSDMPKPKNNKAKWDELLDKKNEVQNLINEKTQERTLEQLNLLKYIETIDDSVVRQGIRGHFYLGKSWASVAMGIPNNTAESVKQACSRYLRK